MPSEGFAIVTGMARVRWAVLGLYTGLLFLSIPYTRPVVVWATEHLGQGAPVIAGLASLAPARGRPPWVSVPRTPCAGTPPAGAGPLRGAGAAQAASAGRSSAAARRVGMRPVYRIPGPAPREAAVS